MLVIAGTRPNYLIRASSFVARVTFSVDRLSRRLHVMSRLSEWILPNPFTRSKTSNIDQYENGAAAVGGTAIGYARSENDRHLARR